LAQKLSRLKVYNALALSILLCGTEIWALKKKSKKLLTSVELKIFRRKAGYTRSWAQQEWRNFGRAERRTIWQETKTIQNKLVTTC